MVPAGPGGRVKPGHDGIRVVVFGSAVMTAPRLSMQGIRKSFGGVAVLDGVDLTVQRGEVVALLGANGAGKSTLMKVLTGLYTREAGRIEIDGAPVAFAAPAAAVAAGIRLLPQEISVLPDLSVAENIFLPDLPMHRKLGFATVDDAAMARRARALLEQLGFAAIAPTTAMKRLSVAEQRIVEIARALAGDARVLVMDEPTAALTEQEARRARASRWSTSPTTCARCSRSPTASWCCATAATPAPSSPRSPARPRS
jgi:ribose transport system ATP-binding protein